MHPNIWGIVAEASVGRDLEPNVSRLGETDLISHISVWLGGVASCHNKDFLWCSEHRHSFSVMYSIQTSGRFCWKWFPLKLRWFSWNSIGKTVVFSGFCVVGRGSYSQNPLIRMRNWAVPINLTPLIHPNIYRNLSRALQIGEIGHSLSECQKQTSHWLNLRVNQYATSIESWFLCSQDRYRKIIKCFDGLPPHVQASVPGHR